MSEQYYSLTDVVNILLVPRLDRIEQKLDRKVDRGEFEELKKEVEYLESNLITTDKVRDIIRSSTSDAETKGWTRRERRIGVILFLVALATLGLGVVSLIVNLTNGG
jgi:hypothetical protein